MQLTLGNKGHLLAWAVTGASGLGLQDDLDALVALKVCTGHVHAAALSYKQLLQALLADVRRLLTGAVGVDGPINQQGSPQGVLQAAGMNNKSGKKDVTKMTDEQLKALANG